jgi:signal transduction histidine kinase
MKDPNAPVTESILQITANPMMVFLVDDQAMVGEALRRLLIDQVDIEFHYCSDPSAAVKQANQIRPTVILQDLVMPEIDGLDLVRRYRANPTTAATPIIVLSSREDAEVKSQAFTAGANDYLVKLPDRIELIARIRYHSKAYLNQLQRDEAYRALRESQQQLLESNTALRVVNERLEAVNRELETFAYSVSHDLRRPLRSIDGFSQALREDYADRLDGQAQEYLQRVCAASQRMGQLIDDMLSLSQLTSGEMRRTTVDLSAMAEAIAIEMQKRKQERQVETIIAPGLVVNADARLLRIALENLLVNAYKFTEKQFQSRIELGVTQREDEAVYFVRDNGAGFDMAYADKLFGPFQRLHSADEFEGTGIGLATVQRVIHRHGGRVWAEGEVEKGATFFFTLPDLDSHTEPKR